MAKTLYVVDNVISLFKDKEPYVAEGLEEAIDIADKEFIKAMQEEETRSDNILDGFPLSAERCQLESEAKSEVGVPIPFSFECQ